MRCLSIRSAVQDASVLAGVGSITYAAWLTTPPLAWLVAGVALVAWGILSAAQHKKENTP